MTPPWKVTKRGMFSKPVVVEHQNTAGKTRYQIEIDENNVVGFSIGEGKGRMTGSVFIRILHGGDIRFRPSAGKDKGIHYVFPTFRSTEYLYRPGDYGDKEGHALAMVALNAVEALVRLHKGKRKTDVTPPSEKRSRQSVRKRHAVATEKVRTTASNSRRSPVLGRRR